MDKSMTEHDVFETVQKIAENDNLSFAARIRAINNTFSTFATQDKTYKQLVRIVRKSIGASALINDEGCIGSVMLDTIRKIAIEIDAGNIVCIR